MADTPDPDAARGLSWMDEELRDPGFRKGFLDAMFKSVRDDGVQLKTLRKAVDDALVGARAEGAKAERGVCVDKIGRIAAQGGFAGCCAAAVSTAAGLLQQEADSV